MARAPEHAPGTPAPVSGLYQQLNVVGTPTELAVRVRRGEKLPRAPIGFAWRLMQETAEDDD